MIWCFCDRSPQLVAVLTSGDNTCSGHTLMDAMHQRENTLAVVAGVAKSRTTAITVLLVKKKKTASGFLSIWGRQSIYELSLEMLLPFIFLCNKVLSFIKICSGAHTQWCSVFTPDSIHRIIPCRAWGNINASSAKDLKWGRLHDHQRPWTYTFSLLPCKFF